MVAAGMILDRLGAVARSRAVPDRSPTGVGFRVKTTYSHEPLELRSRQPRDLPVNVGHDWSRLIGTVRHLEPALTPAKSGPSPISATASSPTRIRSSSASKDVRADATARFSPPWP